MAEKENLPMSLSLKLGLIYLISELLLTRFRQSPRRGRRGPNIMPLSLKLGLVYLVSELLLTMTRRSRSRTGTNRTEARCACSGW